MGYGERVTEMIVFVIMTRAVYTMRCCVFYHLYHCGFVCTIVKNKMKRSIYLQGDEGQRRAGTGNNSASLSVSIVLFIFVSKNNYNRVSHSLTITHRDTV